jgi:hypothetical protein
MDFPVVSLRCKNLRSWYLSLTLGHPLLCRLILLCVLEQRYLNAFGNEIVPTHDREQR